MPAYRRTTLGTYVLPDTNKNAIVLTYASGVSGEGTSGYLRARGGNAAAVFVSQFSTNNDNEPRVRLAAGETYPVPLDHDAVLALYVKGSANDVIEFVSDAAE